MSAGLFDVLGPITVGPSSSHTAGAIRIGLICRMLLGAPVKSAKITFYGSFAETYRGHGTGKAVLGGLLGFNTYNEQVRESFSIAQSEGMEYTISVSDEIPDHPNTVAIEAHSESSEISVVGISVGGGAIEITEIEGHEVNVKCRADTIVVFNNDHPGVVANVAGALSLHGYNIATLSLSRSKRAAEAIMVFETDAPVDDYLLKVIKGLPNVTKVIRIPKL